MRESWRADSALAALPQSDSTAAEKMKALTEAGIRVVESPADIGKAIQEVLGTRASA